MEHPGKIWNGIETWVNKYLGRILPAAALRWFWVLVHVGIVAWFGLITFGSIGLTAMFFNHVMEDVCRERPILVSADRIDPANNGKLIKLCGKVTHDQQLCDPVTGVQARGIRLERQVFREAEHGGHLFRRSFYPSAMQLGAFKLTNFQKNLRYTGKKVEDADLTTGSPAEGYSVTRLNENETPEKGIFEHFEVRSADGSYSVCVWYDVYEADTLYLIGHQLGDEIDFSSENASIHDFKTWHWDADAERIQENIAELSEAFIGLFIAFIATLFILGSLRSGLWHATGGRNIIRLPLVQAALLLIPGAFCMISGLGFLFAGRDEYPTAGMACIILSLGLLGYVLRRWCELRPENNSK